MASKTGTARTTRRRLRSTDEPDPPEPVALSDALPRLASALDEAAEAAGWGGRPSLVRVTAWPSRPVREGFDLGIRPLEDDRSVVEALSGFSAPSEWMAIGVVTEGTARHLVDTTSERRRVRCVHLVDRTGASASTLRLQGEAASVFGGDDDHGRGRIDDACRRALELPTAPPTRSTIELWALVWLDRVLAARAADEAMNAIRAERFAGRTERELSARIRELLLAAGHQSAEFAIVASGPNSASPHHEPSDRVIELPLSVEDRHSCLSPDRITVSEP